MHAAVNKPGVKLYRGAGVANFLKQVGAVLLGGFLYAFGRNGVKALAGFKVVALYAAHVFNRLQRVVGAGGAIGQALKLIHHFKLVQVVKGGFNNLVSSGKKGFHVALPVGGRYPRRGLRQRI